MKSQASFQWTVFNLHGLKLRLFSAERMKREKPIFQQPQGREHLNVIPVGKKQDQLFSGVARE